MQLPQTSVELAVGVRSSPDLADHGFQGLVVLPGSAFVEMALSLHRERFGQTPRVIRNVRFDHPVILSQEESLMRVDVIDRGDAAVAYAFYEADQQVARLEIDRAPSVSSGAGTQTSSIEAFKAGSRSVMESDQFYKKLGENGNEYGPRFQNVSSIWLAGNQALGRISVARKGGPVVHPNTLDSFTQVLAAHILDKGQTFILKSIDTIELIDIDFPDTLWSLATRLPNGNEQGIAGNVRVVDGSGKRYVELSGVVIALLEQVDAAATETTFCIASTFTAEPLEDSLGFWGDYFDLPNRVEFAPYNQVFQQLLDGGSAFRKNGDGVNAILLRLEDWADGDRGVAPSLSAERAEQCFGDHAGYRLPNGLQIVHLNQYETDYVYKEIFESQCYLKHGIRLEDGDTVVDIGANIGLFSLFVMSHCATPMVYAFEPSPVVYQLLKANCEAYGPNLRAFNLGVSDEPKSATFTFYEKSSVFSGFHPDERDDREAIRAVARNVLSSVTPAGELEEDYVSELTADRLDRRTYQCRLTTVSAIMRENGLDKIDLLKIDAEKCEVEIIRGIDDSTWPRIDQIVVEIHDRTKKRVKEIEALLTVKGYRCAVEQETLLEHSGLFNIFATRDTSSFSRSDSREGHRTHNLQRNSRQFCAALSSFTSQGAGPLVLCVCPKSPAAEEDPELKKALEEAERELLSQAARYPNVHIISSAWLLQHHALRDFYDPNTHQLAHVPYTPECYAAIGTALSRTVFNLKGRPFKAIALDCDNTLWKGICGEDGPLGIELTPPYRKLQEFMVGQLNAGMLLCLCSKNNEQDVLDVFEQRPEMVLRRQHFVSSRINWNSKSQNLEALANELNIGLDSFIFLDDNPVDCADVRVNCPDVLTLTLPPNAESFGVFLNHVWAFDSRRSTTEDRDRTRMYQEGAERTRLREQTLSLRDFVEGLQLRVDISVPAPDQLSRVSQLTFRTNQFNFTTIRRSENEVEAFLKNDNARSLTVRAADRFGDYGLVGVALFNAETDRYKVDTLLLSCRALGRGVEHRLLAELGRRAIGEGKAFVEMTCRRTRKNVPAWEFLGRVGDRYRKETGRDTLAPAGEEMSLIFCAEWLAALEYDPDEKPHADQRETATRLVPQYRFQLAKLSDRIQRIAENLSDSGKIAAAIEEYRLRKQPVEIVGHVVRGNTLETALLAIWRKVLGTRHIGLNDNFFDAGGTSLRAVQVIATIKKELKRSVSIVNLFECPTVRLLAVRLSASAAAPDTTTQTAGAALRGQQRRKRIVRRQIL